MQDHCININCKNYHIKNILQPFSREGLCIDCEINDFPQRFHGCIYCRNPMCCSNICLKCNIGFNKWIEKYVRVINYSNDKLMLINDLMSIHEKLAQYANFPFIKNNTNNWPGFYAGNNNWIIPNKIISFKWNNYNMQENIENFYNSFVKNGIDILNAYQISY